MMISVMTRSVGMRASSASASIALSAVRPEYPARSSTYFTESRSSGSSSTTKMFCIFASLHRCRHFVKHFYASDSREKYSERGSHSNLRVDGNASTETLHDAMDHGKAQTCALSDGTRGEERLEYALNRSRVHSPSRVANPEFDARPRHAGFVGMLLTSEADGQNPSGTLHRLIGVGAQVYQQVCCKRGVGSHQWNGIVDFRAYLDARRGEYGKEV